MGGRKKMKQGDQEKRESVETNATRQELSTVSGSEFSNRRKGEKEGGRKRKRGERGNSDTCAS